MKHLHVSFLIAICFFIQGLSAQTIPASRQVDWKGKGFLGCLPPSVPPDRIKNIDAYGGISNGTGDNSKILKNLIKTLSGSPAMAVIQFDYGDYLFTDTDTIPSNIILRGQTPISINRRTNLIFDFGTDGTKNGFVVAPTNKSNGADISVTAGATKGSNTITVSDASSFSTGAYAELTQDNAPLFTEQDSWAARCVGQIVKIEAVVGNTLTISPALRLNYTGNNVGIKSINYVEKVGFESLSIKRTGTPTSGGGANVYMNYAINCWMKDVESSFSMGAHIMAERSSRIEVGGCYFHHSLADYKGASTHGYGILLNIHTGDCLVEDNIFEHLRHSIVMQAGANGNVCAYNYITDTYRTEFPTDLSYDIVCHGYYPFANLFEGNIMQNAGLDNENGINGPYNTFFRNRVKGYGMGFSFAAMSDGTQNFVGNEYTNANPPYIPPIISVPRPYNLSSSYDIGNTIINISPSPINLPEQSYAYSFKPHYFGADNWATIGIPNTINTGTNNTKANPAEKRYNPYGINTIYSKFNAPTFTLGTPTNGSVTISTNTLAVGYLWNTNATGTSITATSLGAYYLDISNNNGCTVRGNIIVSTLPVVLVNFDAVSVENKTVKLYWQTASEHNARSFVVERSADMQRFENIAQIDAIGNSTSLHSYEWIDKKPINGINYYRLQQIDQDGTTTTTRTRATRIEQTDVMNIEPTIVSEGFWVKAKDLQSITIYDMQGQVVVYRQDLQNNAFVDTSSLAMGQYVVQLVNSERAAKATKILVYR
jgi:Secretion system C-terminal sorting domain